MNTRSKTARTKKESESRTEALRILRSPDFFAILRGALRQMGLSGWEERAGLGIYFVATSRFQGYPLRVQIQERTEGTAEYVAKKVRGLLLPDSVVIIRPTSENNWQRLAESPDQKLVVIAAWDAHTENGSARLDVRGEQIVQAIPAETEGRVVEEFKEVKGRFACVSVSRPYGVAQTRWLTMVQPERQNSVPGSGKPCDAEVWHEVERLLQERSKRSILFPEWEQSVMEAMCEQDHRAMRHSPALLQIWRTMTLIRSFQLEKTDDAGVINASFEDLAAAVLLAKKLFREGHWFPSCNKLFAELPELGARTAVLSPVTGKPVSYERPVVRTSYQSALNF